MRFSTIFPAVLAVVSARHANHNNEALLQLGIKETLANEAQIKATAKQRFMTLLHDAEEKAEHDPAVLKAHERVAKDEAKYQKDSRKAADMLAAVKEKLAESKKSVSQEDEKWAIEAGEIKNFINSKYQDLAKHEKEFMALQQKKISSLAEVPMHVQSSFSQLSKSHDGSKATQEINAAEKALRELGDKIKKRVETLTHQLMTPGSQFTGEVVV